jgi:hypothetical protein
LLNPTATTAAPPPRNRHPADELADVRAEIKQLEDREAQLRNALIADGADRSGVQYEAVIFEQRQERLDTKAVIEHFGADALRPFYRKITCKTVRLKRHAAARQP